LEWWFIRGHVEMNFEIQICFEGRDGDT